MININAINKNNITKFNVDKKLIYFHSIQKKIVEEKKIFKILEYFNERIDFSF